MQYNILKEIKPVKLIFGLK